MHGNRRGCLFKSQPLSFWKIFVASLNKCDGGDNDDGGFGLNADRLFFAVMRS